ncbi:hypothetical protein AtEden1_Chr1g0072061 [Arabidopsis thaliana]
MAIIFLCLCLLMKSVPYGTVDDDAHKELCTANLTIFNKLIKNALHTTWQTYTLEDVVLRRILESLSYPELRGSPGIPNLQENMKSDSVAFFTMEYRKPLLLGVEDLSLFDDDDDDDSHSNKRKTPPCSESKRTDKRSSYGHVSEYSSK